MDPRDEGGTSIEDIEEKGNMVLMKTLGQWTESEIDFLCFVRHQPNHGWNMQRPPDLT